MLDEEMNRKRNTNDHRQKGAPDGNLDGHDHVAKVDVPVPEVGLRKPLANCSHVSGIRDQDDPPVHFRWCPAPPKKTGNHQHHDAPFGGMRSLQRHARNIDCNVIMMRLACHENFVHVMELFREGL
jgi:hypothetical protein